MVGMKREISVLRHLLGVIERRDPALEDGRAADGALHGPAHPRPLDRRTRVKQDPLIKPFDYIPSPAYIHQNGVCGEHALHGLAIGIIDRLHCFPRVYGSTTPSW